MPAISVPFIEIDSDESRSKYPKDGKFWANFYTVGDYYELHILEHTCWYCKENDCDDSSGYLRKLQDKKRVGFTYFHLNVPRCKSCKKTHILSKRIGFYLTFPFFLISILSVCLLFFSGFLILNPPEINGIAPFFLFVTLPIGFVFLYKSIKKMYVGWRGILQENAFINYPLLKKFLDDGWVIYEI